MKLIIPLITAASAIDLSWNDYKIKFNKNYLSHEEPLRFTAFTENSAIIDAHNQRFLSGHESFFMGHNSRSDLTFAEFSDILLHDEDSPTLGSGYVCPTGWSYDTPSSTCLGCSAVDDDDQVFDWNQAGYNTMNADMVTPVKDQGSCGSCWAFAGNAVMESQLCMDGYYDCSDWTGISEQNMVDCTKCGNSQTGSNCDNGCSGGWSQNVWNYVHINNDGADSEDSYPYAGKNQACAYDASNDVIASAGASFETVCTATDKNDEVGLMVANNQYGPIKVSVYVVTSFQLYSGGVYSTNSCPNTSTNHAVTVTGYGTDCSNGACMDYWMIKNSWGPSWGLGGYIKFRRNYNSMCAVALKAYWPTIV